MPHLGEQKVIKQMIDLRNKGKSYRAIASALDELGVVTRTGKKWHKTMIQIILDRETNKETV